MVKRATSKAERPLSRVSQGDQGVNGSEVVSRDMDLCSYQRGVTLDLSRPGKRTENAFIEVFNRKLREHALLPAA